MPTLSIRRVPLCPTCAFARALASGVTAGLLALTACSSGSGSTGAGGTTSSTTGTGTGGKTGASAAVGTGGSAGAGGTITTCPPAMKYGGGEQTVNGTAAMATIVDETGTPVGGQPVYICGLNECTNPGTTGANGAVSISTTYSLQKPAFKFGDALDYAELAIPLPAGMTDFDTVGTGELATGKLAGKPGATLAPGADAVSGDVTVSLPAGASVGINILVYGTSDQQQFRSVAIPLTNVGPVFAPVTVGDAGTPADFQLLYGVAPAETTLCPAATVTVALPHVTTTPNDLGWAAGTAVEFWIMTTDTGQTYAPYAGWAKMSDGVVSADGTSVATVPGQGFIFLENFAIRLKS
jgi:hypothetical protein